MSPDEDARATPPSRRDSWSLRSIVQDVSGRPLEEFQDPDRAPHPYLRLKPPPKPPFVAAPPPSPSPLVEPEKRAAGAEAGSSALPAPRGTEDPVARVFPPLTGPTGRALHGPAHEHDAETLAHRPGEGGPSASPHPDSPSRRPERVYLHYLLLHLDRLSDHALRYLKHAVDDEVRHRAEPTAPPTEPAQAPPPAA